MFELMFGNLKCCCYVSRAECVGVNNSTAGDERESSQDGRITGADGTRAVRDIHRFFTQHNTVHSVFTCVIIIIINGHLYTAT